MYLSTGLLLLAAHLGESRLAIKPAWELQQEASFGIASTKHKTDLEKLYPEQILSVPIDHFHNDSRYEPHSDKSFDLRYWYDATYYKEGGPVIVLSGGETSGVDRLPFLQKGIVAKLASALNGVGVILEHRYYGTSVPTRDFSTENLRFLSTEQALADTAYFANNVVFPGLEHLNLTASTTPWIAYGGSYAGAFVAFLRKLYPETFWGSISASGVTQAIIEYWEYMEPIRQNGPPDCIWTTQVLTDVVDTILIDSNNITLRRQLKSTFGLSELRDDVDFANVLTHGIYHWQSRNWDPKVGTPGIMHYCSNLTASEVLYPAALDQKSSAAQLVSAAGYGDNSTIVTRLLNWIGYLNITLIAPETASIDVATRFSTDVSALSSKDSLDDIWRLWPYQVCTQWGYFQTGNVPPESGLPLVSRILDLAHTSEYCSQIFNITTPPKIEQINVHGGYNFSFPRVAMIDGLADPWRPATPHADVAPERESTDSEPFILLDVSEEDVWDGIRGAVHHWDENGVFDNETTAELPPKVIKDVHKEMVRFVGKWLEEWEAKEKKQSTTEDEQKILGSEWNMELK